MIALPLKPSSLLNELFSDEPSVKDIFRECPNDINGFFTNEPWFFFEEAYLKDIEKENDKVRLSDSAKRWNSIKLDIYCTFSQTSFKNSFKTTPLTKSEWEYFIHFNTKQSKKSDLWTKSYPSSCNSEAYWIDEYSKELFGEFTIIDSFKRDPLTIERLLTFDKNLFFDEENILELTAANPNYLLSKRACLWNDEKYNCWLERREEEETESRRNWENRIESEKFQQELNHQRYIDNDGQDYFNAVTDGHLGNFDDFLGSNDDIDDVMGR